MLRKTVSFFMFYSALGGVGWINFTLQYTWGVASWRATRGRTSPRVTNGCTHGCVDMYVDEAGGCCAPNIHAARRVIDHFFTGHALGRIGLFFWLLAILYNFSESSFFRNFNRLIYVRRFSMLGVARGSATLRRFGILGAHYVALRSRDRDIPAGRAFSANSLSADGCGWSRTRLSYLTRLCSVALVILKFRQR